MRVFASAVSDRGDGLLMVKLSGPILAARLRHLGLVLIWTLLYGIGLWLARPATALSPFDQATIPYAVWPIAAATFSCLIPAVLPSAGADLEKMAARRMWPMRILVVVIYLCAAMIACCVALEFSFTAITIALRNLLSISATSIICSTLISSVASWIPTLLYLPAVFLFGHRIGGGRWLHGHFQSSDRIANGGCPALCSW
jgi:hypothetical protein